MNMTPYPEEYIRFLAEYHGSRDYFECHEVMEEYWKDQPHSKYTGCWLVFIRISVACYHARRGNWNGARKMMTKASEEVNPSLMSELGLDGPQLATMLARTQNHWITDVDLMYEPLNLPILDEQLLQRSQQYCLEQGWLWEGTIADTNEELIHKHLRRDRAEVVEARRLSAILKGDRNNK